MPVDYTRIIKGMEINLVSHSTEGAVVEKTKSGWRLSIPPGNNKEYRLAQLDDYTSFSRKKMPHSPPFSLHLQVRLSSANLPGTWGFGLWNDPFGFSLGFGGNKVRFPAFPQTTWFMHASPPNWLSLKDADPEKTGKIIPPNGFFSGTFHSPNLPSLLFIPALISFPLLEIRPISRLLRRMVNGIIKQDSLLVNVDVTQWHEYSLYWMSESCLFAVDGREIFTTPISPPPHLGLVIWIDNQFAAWTPQGRLGYGILENPYACLEINNLVIQ